MTERPLRILFCTIGYEPGPVGGAERQARLQARELRGRGHHVEVVTQRAGRTRSGEVDGVPVTRLPCFGRGPLRTLTYLPAFLVWTFVNLGRFDVVHVHIANLQADVASIAARIRRVPMYVKIAMGGPRGEIARMGRISAVTRYAGIRHAARVQAMSSEIEADLESIGIPPTRIVQIPNGLDVEVYHPSDDLGRAALRRSLDLPLDDVLVLYTGRFAGYKGILDLIAAWERIRIDRPASLVVVGEPALDDPAGDLRLLPAMIVRPWSERAVDYMKASDIYVHPSHADGMPNVILEAMACGLAIVATRVAAVPALIEDGRTGVLVDVGDIGQLADSIQDLIDDAPKRRQLGAAAATEAAARFPISRVVDQIERAYADILSASRSRVA